MYLILIFFFIFVFPAFAVSTPDITQIRQELEQAKSMKSSPAQIELVQTLESILNFMDARNESIERTKQYQNSIANFPKLANELRQKITNLSKDKPIIHNKNMSSSDLDQEILQISSQLLEARRKAQQERDRAREISDSLNELLQQQTESRRALSESERTLRGIFSSTTSPLSQAKTYAYQAELSALKAQVDELDLAQLSSGNRKELARMQAEFHQKKSEQLENYLQVLRNQLNNLRQREAELALANTERLAGNSQSQNLPISITEQFHVNRKLSAALNYQAQRIDIIASQQRQATNQIIQVKQALSTIREQSKWLGASNLLGEVMRAQISRLPEMPKLQQIDNEMGQLRVQRLYYEDLLNQQQQLLRVKQKNGAPLTFEQSRILEAQLKIQKELLNSLISGCDTLILEITKLKVANSQLKDALNEIKETTHRYLFWVADVNPLSMSYPIEVVHDLNRFLSLDTLRQLSKALVMMVTSRNTILPILGALILICISISSRRHYNAFLIYASGRVGKVTQDHFTLTLYTVLWSIFVALPLPVLWGTLGYGLQNAWPYPVALAIGDGVTATMPLLLAFMISATFARPNCLFIVHFRWPQIRVARAMRYYTLSIGFIVPLIMLLITFSNLDDRKLSATLGRLCFILICGALSLVTISLKRAGIPLYLDRKGNGDNITNRILWNLLICIPMIAAFASCIGYLTTAQALLARLETSVAIWLLLLVIYHIIRRWMLIQRRRIAFDRARQRRADILALRARGEEENTLQDSLEIDEPVIDLDTISAQSLRLVRSILTLIALLSLIILWSEIHSAFAFLENIKLWEAISTIQGIEQLHPITLGSILISVLVFIITGQLVRNMPALLELAILQHLNLMPGTSYAITTITKYLLLLIGGLLGFSIIGIEWSKLQWLIAALGVGLGFGLQEIFANFISGLIILFEKPIRIGDTVTIHDLTGNITRINTRATTITDWDRKEIIVPNKAFITEQFVNWSLSDSVTRVVLTIPVPAKVDSKLVTKLLRYSCENCSYVLDTPPPEVFLVDLQQGVQLFELRIHSAEMGHRMPLRHELHQIILQNFQKHNIEIPFPPFQFRLETIFKKTSTNNNKFKNCTSRIYKSGSL